MNIKKVILGKLVYPKKIKRCEYPFLNVKEFVSYNIIVRKLSQQEKRIQMINLQNFNFNKENNFSIKFPFI